MSKTTAILEAYDAGLLTNGYPLFVDLIRYLNDDCEPEKPEIGQIEGGGTLLYSGRLNEIHGEPSAGKTNVELSISLDVLRRGSVIFIDPEDTPRAIINRLLSFGADSHAILERFHYIHNPEACQILQAIEWNKVNPVELVCIDGLAELLAARGVSENDPTEILRFFRAYIRPFAESGSAVLVSDHVTKDSDSRGRWSRGSGAKLGRYDGAVYSCKVIREYGPTQAGAVKLTVAKDRNGGVGHQGIVAAEVHFKPIENGSGTLVRIKAPGNFQLSALMEKVSRAIEADSEISKRDLRKLGKASNVDKAIEYLEEAGFLKVTKSGPGLSNRYEILKVYREDQENIVGREPSVLQENDKASSSIKEEGKNERIRNATSQ